jgi:hypothetical protein
MDTGTASAAFGADWHPATVGEIEGPRTLDGKAKVLHNTSKAAGGNSCANYLS